MDPTVIGTKIASGLVGPLVKRLFVQAGPGAGLVDKPVRLSARGTRAPRGATEWVRGRPSRCSPIADRLTARIQLNGASAAPF
ncbi:hypothetical protein [Streptomyces chartreusis]|uniref:hypothetical protein n=1 Tax=Streptomyces chartreusis TaxID=1969 RepID=UPI003659F4DA